MVRLDEHYIGSMKYDVYWKCGHGHYFKAHEMNIEHILENELCPCCLKLKGKNPYLRVVDCSGLNSLFNLDYELFDGQLDKWFVQSDDNYINGLSYKATKKVDWNIEGNMISMSPAEIVKEYTKRNQYKLKEIYDGQVKKKGDLFEVVQCEACGKYMPHYKLDNNIENEKCMFCDEFIHNPFSFGRWLDKNASIKEELHKTLDEKDLKKIRGLNKNDTDTQIIIPRQLGIIRTTAFDITHNNIAI